jgi:hypothetical protein
MNTYIRASWSIAALLGTAAGVVHFLMGDRWARIEATGEPKFEMPTWWMICESMILGLILALLFGGIGILLACSMSACKPKGPQSSSKEISGAKAERVAEVSKLIRTTIPLPGPILDAQFVEEQTGDGRIGPSDFASFCALTVAPEDLGAWRKALQPLEPQNTPPRLVNPKQAHPWWVTTGDFSALEFHSPKSLTGRHNGWVGIAPDGRIFVYSFTM